MTEFYGEFSCESRETGLKNTRKEGRRVRPPTPLMPAYFATRRAERQRLDSRCARYFSRATFHAYGIDDDFSTGDFVTAPIDCYSGILHVYRER